VNLNSTNTTVVNVSDKGQGVNMNNHDESNAVRNMHHAARSLMLIGVGFLAFIQQHRVAFAGS
jgi:hypothetical protein